VLTLDDDDDDDMKPVLPTWAVDDDDDNKPVWPTWAVGAVREVFTSTAYNAHS
jgi:hypothetical protein